MSYWDENLRSKNKRRKELQKELWRLILIVLATAVVWVLIIVWICSDFDDWKSGITIAAFMIITLFALTTVAALIVYFSPQFEKISKELEALKCEYEASLTEEEKKKRKQYRTKNALIVGSVITVGIIAAISISIIITSPTRKTYEQAVALTDAGSYKEAKELFEKIEKEDYKDTHSYISLCQSHIFEQKGGYYLAYCELDGKPFKWMTLEQHNAVRDYMHELYPESQEDLREIKERNKESELRSIRSGIPFVGMSEEYIGQTSLGTPDHEVRHDREVTAFEVFTANIYDFKKGGKVIFTARCVNGKVTKVFDERGKSDTVVSIPKKSSKSSSASDPYHAKDYANEDFFYDDYRDDFSDYEEAEEYYNDHYDD